MDNKIASPAANDPATYQVSIAEVIDQEQSVRINEVHPDPPLRRLRMD